MKFYAKANPDVPLDEQPYVSHMLPKFFCETYIRVYCKNLDILESAARYIMTFIYEPYHKFTLFSWFETWREQYNDALSPKC